MVLHQAHVMFDLDGTLVDTRAAVTECYSTVFREMLGTEFPPAGVSIGDLFAMRPWEVFSSIAPDRAKALYDAYSDAYPRCTRNIKVFAGVRELVRALDAEGRKLSLVTNKGIERTLIDLEVAGIPPEAFVAIVTAEDTQERKPHPAPILLGMERAGAAAGDAVYVGDGPQDVMAARAAGMKSVAVTYGFYGRDILAARKPDMLVDSVAGLAAALGVQAVGEIAS